ELLIALTTSNVVPVIATPAGGASQTVLTGHSLVITISSTAPTRTRLLHKPVRVAQLIEAVEAVRWSTAPNEASATSFCG
ncbi:MAG TPA: hypothetical protein PLJ65_10785, partial [Casimicrobium sp.]|nr:hypothetical protein [Casimicrobium sp.]